jgi:UDP-N-acetylglucosamine 2-epimerase (non-hydrolysing)
MVRDRPRVVAVAGTRPEVIKLAPVVMAARKPDAPIAVEMVLSGQHPGARAMLQDFGLDDPGAEVLPREHLGLEGLLAELLHAVGGRLRRTKPDLVLVQGDTSTTLAATLVAFYDRVPVAHLEAGLRTHDLTAPFPEEMHRRAVATMTSLHLAATDLARRALAREGVEGDAVVVTGNTVVDAFRWAVSRHAPYPVGTLERIDADDHPLVVVTAHRRESWGPPMGRIIDAINQLVTSLPDVWFVVCLHPNPKLAATVRSSITQLANVVTVPAVPYLPFARLLARATVVLTDSGGIQEEAPSLGTPVVVLRDTTERIESVRGGLATLAGTDPHRIIDATLRALRRAGDPGDDRVSPYGDGHAAPRVIDAMAWFLERGERPSEFGAST